LTGRYAFIGEVERDGLLLGVEEINARGGINGRRLELLAEDNLGDSKTALTSVNKLLTVDQVDVVFSAFMHITQAIKGLMAR